MVHIEIETLIVYTVPFLGTEPIVDTLTETFDNQTAAVQSVITNVQSMRQLHAAGTIESFSLLRRCSVTP